MAARRWQLGLGVVAALCLYLGAVRALWWLCDDAYISFTYARHLAAGEGLRFNLGADPPVEGYSNLWWVLLAALCEAVGASPAVVMPVVSALAGVGTLLLTGWCARRVVGVQPSAALCAVLLLATAPGMAAWASSGLETMPVALGMLAGTALVVAGEGGAARAAAVVCAVGLVGLRTEGWGWVAVIAAAGALSRRAEGRSPGAVWWAFVGAGAAATLAQLGFRLVYHQAWTSTAAAVKLVWGPAVWWRGLIYVVELGLTWWTPLLIGWGWWSLREEPASARWRPFGWVAAVVCGWSALVGGDYLPFHRFLLPALPLFAVCAAVMVERLARRSEGLAALVVAGCVLVQQLPLHGVHLLGEQALFELQDAVGSKRKRYESDLQRLAREREAVPVRLARAVALSEVSQPGDTIVARGVGALGYASELTIYDTHGLVSREVVEQAPERGRLVAPGHDRRVQRGFFLERQPRFLFVFAVSPERKDAVVDLLPTQWGLFERFDDGGPVYVAELHTVRERGPHTAPYLLLVRRAEPEEDPEQARDRFKEAVRAAGFRAPRLAPLDERRRAVALEKRAGGGELMQVLWGPRGVPRKAQ